MQYVPCISDLTTNNELLVSLFKLPGKSHSKNENDKEF